MPEPSLTIVVPVHGVERYLGECLDSVLPPDSGAAVIAVDDASPDGCAAILGARAASDPRLAVISNSLAAGPGPARNEGLASARGEYVWFVDGDDALPPGAIGAVLAALAAQRPDVLLIGYEELWPDGRVTAPPGNALLAAAPRGTFTLDADPGLVNLTMTGWSKVFRREFLIALGEPFRPGVHEDVPVTCAALLADRLAVLAQPCYRYRRSREGSYLATTSDRHLAIFSSYAEVFKIIENRIAENDAATTTAVRDAFFTRAISHYCSILSAGLVPRGARREFFQRMHDDYLRYRPDGYRRPGGARGAKLALVEKNAYALYEFLEPVNRLRVAAHS